MANARGIRPNRRKSQRHPMLWGRSKSVWWPDCVGVVPAYPQTLEAFDKKRAASSIVMKKAWADGKMAGGRKGIPDGWAGRRAKLKEVRDAADVVAKEKVRIMADQGLLPFGATGTDAEHATTALEFAVSTVIAKDDDGCPAATIKDRLAAAALVLKYTKSPPATKSELSISKAEDFLASLVG